MLQVFGIESRVTISRSKLISSTLSSTLGGGYYSSSLAPPPFFSFFLRPKIHLANSLNYGSWKDDLSLHPSSNFYTIIRIVLVPRARNTILTQRLRNLI